MQDFSTPMQTKSRDISQKTISLLTFNTLGIPFFAPDITKRYKKISELINDGNYDIVCLQELFTYYNLYLFKTALPEYRYVFYQKNPLGPKGGLVIFSKFELLDKAFFTYTFPTKAHVPFFAHVAQPGILSAVIKHYDIRLLTTHLSSDIVSNLSPKNKFYALIQNQSKEAAALIKQYTKSGKSIIFAGDFNIDKYSQLYREFITNTHLSDIFKKDEISTYSNDRIKGFYSEPPGRIDYIFISPQNIHSIATNHVFSEKETLANGKKSFLSDHIGLHCILSVNK